MVTKSKLKMALAADKGTDFKKLHLKKKEKSARKKVGKVLGEGNGKKTEEEWEDVEDEEEDELEESGREDDVDGPMKVCCLPVFNSWN